MPSPSPPPKSATDDNKREYPFGRHEYENDDITGDGGDQPDDGGNSQEADCNNEDCNEGLEELLEEASSHLIVHLVVWPAVLACIACLCKRFDRTALACRACCANGQQQEHELGGWGSWSPERGEERLVAVGGQ